MLLDTPGFDSARSLVVARAFKKNNRDLLRCEAMSRICLLAAASAVCCLLCCTRAHAQVMVDGSQPVATTGAAPIAKPTMQLHDSEAPPQAAKPTRAYAIAAWSIGGAALVVSVATAVVAANAKAAYDQTTYMKRAADLDDRFSMMIGTSLIAGVVAVAGGVSGFLLWPSVHAGAHSADAGLVLHASF